MTQYLLSIYRDDRRLSEAEFQQSYKDVNAVADELTAAGGLVFGGGLNPSPPTVLRSVNGKVVTTDGPFAETKEQLGGYYLLEATDLNDAIKVAARIPGARTGSIEVRPIMVFSNQPS